MLSIYNARYNQSTLQARYTSLQTDHLEYKPACQTAGFAIALFCPPILIMLS